MGVILNAAKRILAKSHNAIIIPMAYIFDSNKVVSNGSLNKGFFLGKIFAQNSLISVIQSYSVLSGNAIEAALSELLFISGKFWYYKFLINPTDFSFNPQKLQAEEEVSDMPVINTYRNKVIPMTFTGISGCTLPRGIIQATDQEGKLPMDTLARNPKLSAAWYKFRQLEKFYNEINGDIVILFDMDLYVGKFVSLNYTLDADNPWVINYTLQMKIYPDMYLFGALNAVGHSFEAFFESMNDRYGRAIADDFEGKSKEREKFSFLSAAKDVVNKL